MCCAGVGDGQSRELTPKRPHRRRPYSGDTNGERRPQQMQISHHSSVNVTRATVYLRGEIVMFKVWRLTNGAKWRLSMRDQRRHGPTCVCGEVVGRGLDLLNFGALPDNSRQTRPMLGYIETSRDIQLSLRDQNPDTCWAQVPRRHFAGPD